jgi:hypothetical protein
MKIARIVIVLLGLGIPALAIAHAATSDSSSCCQPNAACCHDPSCPFCHHAK